MLGSFRPWEKKHHQSSSPSGCFGLAVTLGKSMSGSMASKHWKKRDPRHLKNCETKIGSLVTMSLYFIWVLHWMRLYPQRPYQSLKGGCLSQAHKQGATIDWLVAVGYTVIQLVSVCFSDYLCISVTTLSERSTLTSFVKQKNKWSQQTAPVSDSWNLMQQGLIGLLYVMGWLFA